jgi:hypothetical protein
MSQILETQNIEQLKQEMGPVKLSQILRQTKVKQIECSLSDKKGGFCALGALAHFYGWDGEGPAGEFYGRVMRELHKGDLDTADVYTKNDYGWSFDRIADFLEERGL